jgi:hypothetical protein
MRRRAPIGASIAVAVAVCASVAWASTVTVKLTDPKGGGKPPAPDIRSASVSYDGTTLKHTIVTFGSFKTGMGPCLVISRPGAKHDLLMCNDGEVAGFGSGGPHVKVGRPSSKSVTYTFKPGKLKISGMSYKWNVDGQTPDGDTLPGRGPLSVRAGCTPRWRSRRARRRRRGSPQARSCAERGGGGARRGSAAQISANTAIATGRDTTWSTAMPTRPATAPLTTAASAMRVSDSRRISPVASEQPTQAIGPTSAP